MTPIPALAASAIVVYEPIDGGVDHEEEVALVAKVTMIGTDVEINIHDILLHDILLGLTFSQK